MTKKLGIYRCEICGNIVEVLHTGAGELICCGEPMKLMEEKTEEQGREKHLPVIEKTEKGIKVKVGSIPHPMEEKHYIEWIRIVSSTGLMQKFLKPGEVPEAEFPVEDKNIEISEYCNIHGLWIVK